MHHWLSVTEHITWIRFCLKGSSKKTRKKTHPSCQAPWDHGGQGTKKTGDVSGSFGRHRVAPRTSKADSTKAFYRSDWWNLIYFVTALLRQPVTPTFAERGWFLGIGVDWTTVTFYHGMKSDLVNIWRTFGQPSWPSKFKISNINMTKKIFVSTVNYCSR